MIYLYVKVLLLPFLIVGDKSILNSDVREHGMSNILVNTCS